MAPPKHQKEKLVEVAKEGFALLDEFYGRPKKYGGRLPTTTQAYDHYQMHHQYNYYKQYRGPQVITIREPVINSNQAAQFYGGAEIVDYSFRKPIPRAYN